ncbi:AMP phosphorylase [Candidatus Woesearchaeota archaeon B3_Woes]|nr:MAG: AMP phosphorylase [Candidatus Woesearchaeota archaeon B3_Woes]
MKRLKVKDMNISTGGILVAILNEEDASQLDLHSLDRIKVRKGKKEATIVLDIAESGKAVRRGYIGLFEEIIDAIDAENNDVVEIIPAGKPISLEYIKKKLDGRKLTQKEINQIVWDIVHNKLQESEMTYFVAAGYANKLDMEETVWLTKAMRDTGDILKFKNRVVVDKHCVGGLAGNRTTMIIVPIVAAAGLTIPKTSSRSITSPSGTADTVEVFTNVSLDIKQMKKVVKKTNGCLVWGGSLNLSPADDKIINVERPLSIDAESQLLASVMSKKASVSTKYLLIDIPVGVGSKITHKDKAAKLKRDFEEVSKKLGIKTKVIITDGKQPIGNGIGPGLEARDVLYVLKRDKKRPLDLEKKSLMMAGIMLEMGGKAKKGQGFRKAQNILESGKAYKKFIEIIKAQGGKEILPNQIKIGNQKFDLKSHKDGKLHIINNRAICKIARVAGAPNDKGAGIYLHKHVGDYVKKGETLLTIYAHNKIKLDFAKKALIKLDGMVIKQ